MYSKSCVKRLLSKRPKIGFQDQLSLNAGQTFCRMIQGEHSAIRSTFIKLPFVINIVVSGRFTQTLLYLHKTVHKQTMKKQVRYNVAASDQVCAACYYQMS